MKYLEKKKKIELIELITNLQHEKELLEQDVDYWMFECNDIKEEIDRLNKELKEMEVNYCIKDLDYFITRLKNENYDLFEKIEPFIENYLKFYNK